MDICETCVTSSRFSHWMWPGLFSPFNVLGLWSASGSCAWSFPLSFFDSSGRAKGVVGCKQCLGNARSSCHAIAAALISLVSIVCYFNQYRVPSAFTNQGLLQYLAMIFVSYGGGSVHRRAVFFQWVKYRYEPTSDPCALAFNSFSSDRIAQKERKGWWGTEVGWTLGHSLWYLGP